MQVIIRDACLDDVPLIAEFNRAMARETEGRQLDPDTVRAGVRAVFERPGTARYYVAARAGAVIGQLMLTTEWSDWRNGVFWWIQSVYVHPDHRRGGVFRALYRHVEELARQTPGVCGLRLYVEEENDRAMATYRDLGMRPSGHAVYEIDWVLADEVKPGRGDSRSE
jgi:ribosomal protein S18 acetylase RimI-like enzyme